MEVEVVRWSDKTSMDKIVNKSFTDIEEAHTYYTNWHPPEYDDDNFLIKGKYWNNINEKKIKIPNNYKYKYTYSVNIWFEDEMEHSHNFKVYKSPN